MQKTSKGWVFKSIQLFLCGKRHGKYCHDTIKCHVTQANKTNNKPRQSNCTQMNTADYKSRWTASRKNCTKNNEGSHRRSI